MGQMMEIHGPITETQRYPLCVSEQEPIGNHRSVLSGALSGSLWDSFAIPFRYHEFNKSRNEVPTYVANVGNSSPSGPKDEANSQDGAN